MYMFNLSIMELNIIVMFVITRHDEGNLWKGEQEEMQSALSDI